MWKAVVVVCSLTAPDKCETWIDAIGPSKNRDKCISRALEMNAHAFTHLRDYKGEPAWKGKSYRCDKLPNGTL